MQAPALIAVLRGPRHVIELANPAMCELWGRELEDVIGRPLFEAVPELRDQVFPALLDEVYRGGKSYVGKETPTTLDRGQGRTETLYLNFTYSPLRNADGEIDGIFVITSDVTEQVLAPNRSTACAKRLKRPVWPRTSSWRCLVTNCGIRYRQS